MYIRQITLTLLIAAVPFAVACGSNVAGNAGERKAACSYIPIRPAKTPEPEVPSPKSALKALARALAALDLVALEACYTPERWRLERVTREKQVARLKEMGVTSIVLTYQDADLKEVNGGDFVSVWAKLEFVTDSGSLSRESGEAWLEEEQFIMKREYGVWRFTK